MSPPGFLKALAAPRIFFYALLWLMVLTVAGTVAQKYVGLYLAQKTYFSSFVIWIAGVVPLPGGYTTLSIIFLNLVAKLMTERWTRQKLGTIIVHCGAALLLFGGFLTAVYSTEGSMVIPEGQKSNYISDYHKRELAVINVSHDTYDEVTAFGPSWLKAGKTLRADTLPFEITIERYCHNCWIVQRRSESADPKTHGLLRRNDIQAIPPDPEDEKNRSGVIFSISGADPVTDGRYGVFEFMPVVQSVTVDGMRYDIVLRRARTYLPFSIELVDFQKEVYPGTQMARSYQSEVILREGDLEWRSLIYMNHPLHHRGYTFFQSSFMQDGLEETTVLAVVKNIGKIYPYIASIIICIGLLIHMIITVPKLTARKEGKTS